MYMYLYIYIHTANYQSINQSINQSNNLSIYLSIYLSVYLSKYVVSTISPYLIAHLKINYEKGSASICSKENIKTYLGPSQHLKRISLRL